MGPLVPVTVATERHANSVQVMAEEVVVTLMVQATAEMAELHQAEEVAVVSAAAQMMEVMAREAKFESIVGR